MILPSVSFAKAPDSQKKKIQRVILLIKPKIQRVFFTHIELEFWKIDEPRSIFHSSDGRHVQVSTLIN